MKTGDATLFPVLRYVEPPEKVRGHLEPPFKAQMFAEA
jgi:hypothetical protein